MPRASPPALDDARVPMTAVTPLGRVMVRAGSAGPRRTEPLTFGVPLPRGRVHDVATLTIDSGGAPLPTQARALDHWADGSVRWALIDTRAEVRSEGAVLVVRDDLAAPPVTHPLTVTITARQASVTSGDTRIDLDLERGHPFVAVLDGDRPVIDAARAAVRILAADGQPMPVRFAAITAEVAGPLRVVLCVDGEASGATGSRIDVRLRLTFLAGLPVMGLELALRNPQAAAHPGGFWELGDPGSIRLREVAVDVPLPGAAGAIFASLERGAPLQAAELPFTLTQHSSGGEHWASAVHVNSAGAVTLERRGYTTHAGRVEGAGLRATPLIAAEHDGGVVWVAAEHFWEVFPKALAVAADGLVRVACLPEGRDAHELQGGERCDYEFWIAWGEDGIAGSPLEWRRSPSTALPEAAAVGEAERLPGLEAAEPAENPVYEELIGAALDGDDTFLAKRERIDEYGWRNYGDLYADHENGSEPGRQIVSHYNNQYDPIHGLTVQALRHDDHRWWDQARALARARVAHRRLLD